MQPKELDSSSYCLWVRKVPYHISLTCYMYCQGTSGHIRTFPLTSLSRIRSLTWNAKSKRRKEWGSQANLWRERNRTIKRLKRKQIRSKPNSLQRESNLRNLRFRLVFSCYLSINSIIAFFRCNIIAWWRIHLLTWPRSTPAVPASYALTKEHTWVSPSW